MSHTWCIEEIEKLIELIHVNPCLWDRTDPDYTDPTTRKAAFDSIAKMLNLPAELIRSKFKNLRAQYLRTLRNPYKCNSPRRWVHFDALHFLTPVKSQNQVKNECSESTSSLKNENNIEDADENNYEIESLEYIEEVTMSNEDGTCEQQSENTYDEIIEYEAEVPKVNVNSTQTTTTYQASGVPNKSSNSKLKIVPKMLVMKPSTCDKDQHTLFGEHVANELRALRNRKPLQQSLKCAILKAIYEANQALT